MREFMDYVHGAFYEATGWSRDNSYASLNSTSDALLNFPTPRGLRLTLSALASPNFATSYQLGSVGVVDGSISYLFSSVPLRVLLTPQSAKVALPELLRSYRPLTPLAPAEPTLLQRSLEAGSGSNMFGGIGGIGTGAGASGADGQQASLLYGRLYLPQSQLEGLAVKRLSRRLQVQFSAVSGQHLRNGGTTLGLAQYDAGKYALEGLASSDGGLLGLRGIYNFGGDAEQPDRRAEPETLAAAALDVSDAAVAGAVSKPPAAPGGPAEKERIYGRFSTGAEIYYGTLNKSGGISLATRFATLPSHRGTPLSATLTLNPLMGSVGASYAVVAGDHCSLATRMEFNVFSYESAWAVGMELWRRPFARPPYSDDSPEPSPRTPPAVRERSFKAKMQWRLDDEPGLLYAASSTEEPGVLSDGTGEEDPFSVATSAASSGGSSGSAAAESQRVRGHGDELPEPTAAAAAARASSSASSSSSSSVPELRQPGWKRAEEYAGVLKARLDQNLRIGLLWEGRVKSLLFSVGSGIDLRHMDKPFRTLGLEIQFSS